MCPVVRREGLSWIRSSPSQYCNLGELSLLANAAKSCTRTNKIKPNFKHSAVKLSSSAATTSSFSKNPPCFVCFHAGHVDLQQIQVMQPLCLLQTVQTRVIRKLPEQIQVQPLKTEREIKYLIPWMQLSLVNKTWLTRSKWWVRTAGNESFCRVMTLEAKIRMNECWMSLCFSGKPGLLCYWNIIGIYSM